MFRGWLGALGLEGLGLALGGGGLGFRVGGLGFRLGDSEEQLLAVYRVKS